MTRERRRQKLWAKLADLQRQYVRELVRHQAAADTLKAMTQVRADILKLENREAKERQREAA